MVRRASKKKKDRPTREIRKVILVSAEGMNKTERTYFAEFNRLQKDYHIVFATGTSTDPVNIVSEAIDGVTKNGLNLRQGDIACAVFDADFGKAGKIKEADQKVADGTTDYYTAEEIRGQLEAVIEKRKK